MDEGLCCESNFTDFCCKWQCVNIDVPCSASSLFQRWSIRMMHMCVPRPQHESLRHVGPYGSHVSVVHGDKIFSWSLHSHYSMHAVCMTALSAHDYSLCNKRWYIFDKISKNISVHFFECDVCQSCCRMKSALGFITLPDIIYDFPVWGK